MRKLLIFLILIFTLHSTVLAQDMECDEMLADGATAQMYFERGYACYEEGKYDQSLTDFTQALTLEPDYMLAYIGRGDT